MFNNLFNKHDKPLNTEVSEKTYSVSIDYGKLYVYDAELSTYLVALFNTIFKDEIVAKTIAPGRYCLAGGAIRSYYENRKPRDLDFYILEDTTYRDILNVVETSIIAVRDPLTEFGCDTDNSSGIRFGKYTYPYKYINHISLDSQHVQFLQIKYVPKYNDRKLAGTLPKVKDLKDDDFIMATTLNEILEGFDFACCQAGIEFSIEKHTDRTHTQIHVCFKNFKQSSKFLMSIAKRDLILAEEYNMQKCGVSYYRLHKYLTEYGYKISSANAFTKLERFRKSAILDGYDPDASYDSV